jgi:hypothetical protein
MMEDPLGYKGRAVYAMRTQNFQFETVLSWTGPVLSDPGKPNRGTQSPFQNVSPAVGNEWTESKNYAPRCVST